ncbi:MAG: hypothetical protein FWC68_02920 [Oscillospiraceae bacterium]|nr:hypothetical protein [Oscillospiraceae bacterium]
MDKLEPEAIDKIKKEALESMMKTIQRVIEEGKETPESHGVPMELEQNADALDVIDGVESAESERADLLPVPAEYMKDVQYTPNDTGQLVNIESINGVPANWKQENGLGILEICGHPILQIDENGLVLWNLEELELMLKKENMELLLEEKGLQLPNMEYLIELKERGELELVQDKEYEYDGFIPDPDREWEYDGFLPGVEPDEQEMSDEDKEKAYGQKLCLTSKVAGNDTLVELIPGGKNYSEMYISEDKNTGEYTIKGVNKHTGEFEDVEGLERVETDHQKTGFAINDSAIQEQDTSTMVRFRIKGGKDEGFSLRADPGDKTQMKMEYWRRIDIPEEARKNIGLEQVYASSTVSQAYQQRGANMPAPEARYFMAKDKTTKDEMGEMLGTYKQAEEMEEDRTIDDELIQEIKQNDEIQLEQLPPREVRTTLIEAVRIKILHEYRGNNNPDAQKTLQEMAESKAERTVDYMLNNNMRYQDARDKVDREDGERKAREGAEADKGIHNKSLTRQK